MEILFCANPLNSKKVDSEYILEAEACSLPYFIINYEALTDEINTAVRWIPKTEEIRLAIYRGWMMTPETYTTLYHALENHGVRLINTPTQYQYCHYLPESYSLIQALTPKTVWIRNGEDFSIDAIMKVLEPFGNHPIILKDYVKSQKHYWNEACFIPSAADKLAVSKVVQRFIELQGGQIAGGLVFRQYVAFEPIGSHWKSGMPLTLEYRIFFLHKKPIAVYQYWDNGKYSPIELPLEAFIEIAQNVNSEFFTMDIAKSEEFGWLIVELGDAQVAGLPENTDIKDFYSVLEFNSSYFYETIK